MQSDKNNPAVVLLDRTIASLENNTGDFNMEDVMYREGDVIRVGGELVSLNILETGFIVSDEDSKLGVVHMFESYFEPASVALRDMIIGEGYNVCRPIGVVDPSLIAKEGIIQLCRRGRKISLYMAHKFRDGNTTVKLQMLVGKL